MKNYQSQIREYLQKEIEVINSLSINDINHVMNEIERAYNSYSRIYIFGNGGSAATASHYTNDFNKGISEFTTNKFNFICLNDNVATLMAISNDLGYEQVFDFQLRGRLQKSDLVIGISGSGNSNNVIRAIEYANSVGAVTIGISGYDGGKLKELCQISLNVPIHDMQITEDIHMIFDHLMMSIFLRELKEK